MPKYIILDKDGDYAGTYKGATPVAAYRNAVRQDDLDTDFGPYSLYDLPAQPVLKVTHETEKVTRIKVRPVK